MGCAIGLDFSWVIKVLWFAITNPLPSQITATSLCLIKVFLVIHVIANIRYGYRLVLNMVVRKTSIVFTCK
jgi:hypothetical protein